MTVSPVAARAPEPVARSLTTSSVGSPAGTTTDGLVTSVVAVAATVSSVAGGLSLLGESPHAVSNNADSNNAGRHATKCREEGIRWTLPVGQRERWSRPGSACNHGCSATPIGVLGAPSAKGHSSSAIRR